VSYQQAYALLWVPLVLVLVAAFLGQRAVPQPEKLEQELSSDAGNSTGTTQATPNPEALTRTFWVYSLFTLLVGIGFVNFTLLSFHAVKAQLLTDAAVPFWYAVAMAANAVAAYVVGTLYDRYGLKVLFAVPLLSIPLPLLGFLGGTTPLLVAAIVLFGFSLGIQETILKAGIADLTPLKKRGTGYGIFNTVNGVGLLASGALMGLLYDVSLAALCAVSIIAELTALVVLYLLLRQGKKLPAAR
jgi:MFS family permease